MSRRRPAATPSAPAGEVFTITDLDQLRALADPLRVRIVEAFCDGERTTKQVADLLGEKATRLYHHVAELVRVGLLEPTRRQQKRGTVEKYYRAVARAFRADPRLFTSGGAALAGGVEEAALSVLEATAAELRRLAAGGGGESRVGGERVVSYLEVRAGPREMKRLRSKLDRWLQDVAACRAEGAGRRYRVTLALYPLDP